MPDMTVIQIVDDNAQNLYMLKVLLEGHGYSVRSAEEGSEALELAKTQPPDLIISDILMPVMDGFTLCRKWVADDRLKSIPFVFYTATYTDPEDEKFALGLGAVRFIIKPEDPEIFMGIIKNVLDELQNAASPPSPNPLKEDMYLKEYNERLIHKLEKRSLDLEKEIADRKIMEKALRHSQRMEAMGTLASGIAHDFNNFISAIIGRGEIARTRLHEPENVAEDLDIIIRAGKRASELVKQIQTFSRIECDGLQPVSLQSVIDEVQGLLVSTITEDITLTKSVPGDVPLILGDHTQLLQVVMNLCKNGCQAMGDKGGTLHINLSQMQVNGVSRVQGCPQLLPGHYLDLAIGDNGCGMDEDMMEKIFDPFFTTKEKGEGTGLGLSVVHGIVRRHRGEMSVKSSPGVGSTFHIYLPIYIPSPS